MTLLNPAGLLLLLSLPVIVLLHLFRQERRRQEVSSLFLWREISASHSHRIRPRLLSNIHLILQLLAATAAALALSQPALPSGAGGASRMVILIDTSASMRAREDQITRLELAKNRAREVIGRSRRDTQFMVATLGPRPSVLQSFTADRPTLYEIIRAIQAEDGAGNLHAAAQMLRRLNTGTVAAVHLITDGAFEPDGRTVLPGALTVELVGTSVANRAITAFEVRRRPDGSALEAYLEVSNSGAQTAEVMLEVIADGQTVSRRELSLAADEVRPLSVTLPARGSIIAATLAGNDDPLATDDTAYLVARTVRPLRVQLVTGGNFFLESVLAVYPNVVLTVTPTLDRTRPYDLLILDRVDAPAGVTGSIVSMAAAVPGAPFSAGEMQLLSRPITVDRAHPLAADVDLAGVNITRAYGGSLAGRSRIVASSGGVPLIYTAAWDGVRMVGFTFSLADTDLGLRSSFPILMNNVITWLAPSPQEEEIGSVAAGSVVPLLVSPGEPARVTTPSGVVFAFEPRENTVLFGRTGEAGIYTVTGPTFSDAFAVSLNDREESDLRPRFVPPEAVGAGVTGPGDTPGAPLWPWLVLLALVILTADWVIWARRT